LLFVIIIDQRKTYGWIYSRLEGDSARIFWDKLALAGLRVGFRRCARKWGVSEGG
jgi:hypothetical protein